MASSKKIDYQHPLNFIVKFSWNDKVTMLLLGYNINNFFQFIDLKTGRILNISFSSVEKAVDWLKDVSTILEENAICTTYVP